MNRRKFLEVSAMLGAVLLAGQACVSLKTRTVGPDDYDLAVIGAGLGGLSCAALLARRGLRPLVLERHVIPGGYATSFTRYAPSGQAFTCEVSLHSTEVASPSSARLLSELGLDGKLKYLPHEYVLHSTFPDFALKVPAKGLAGFKAQLLEIFPNEKGGLDGFFDYWEKLRAELADLDQKGMPKLQMQFPSLYPTLWDINGKSLAAVLGRYLKNEKLHAAIAQQWGYYGLPPEKLAAFYYLCPLGDYLEYGGCYIEGSSQALSDALSEVITKGGGKVLLGETVTAINLESGRAAGVRTASGREFRARAVVCNAAAPQVFGKLLPAGAVPAEYAAKLAGFAPSLSSFQLWLGLSGTPAELGLAGESVWHPGYDFAASYRGVQEAAPEKTLLAATCYDSFAPGFSPPGTCTLNLLFLSGYAPWQGYESDYLAGKKEAYNRFKDELTGRVIALASKLLKVDLAKKALFIEAATPLTNLRFTKNPAGAIYGYDQTPGNSFINRLSVRTPVKGLYLSSAWGDPGGGYGGALLAGKNAALALTKDWARL